MLTNEKLKDIHLRSVMIAIFLLLIILPFLLLTGVYLRVSQDYAKKSYGNYMVQVVNGIQKETEETAKRLVDGTMNFYHNGLVNLLSKDRLTDGEEQEVWQKLTDILNAYSGSVSSIFLEYEGRQYFAGVRYQAVFEQMSPYQKEIQEKKGRHVWYGPYRLIPRRKSGEKMILAKSLNGENEKNIAVVYLVIDLEEFGDAFAKAELEGVSQYLFNQEGSLIYHRDESERLGQLGSEQLSASGKDGYHIAKIKGNRYLTVCERSEKTGWTAGICVPMQTLLRGFKPVQIMLGVLAGVYLLFLSGMLFLLERYIVHPIRTLTDRMDSFARGDFEVTAETVSIGELNRLNRHFNRMTVRIQELIQQNEREVHEKNEFKMQTLRAQLSPHFMYNSLNTIKWMAVINKQDNIQNLTEALIQLLMSHTRGKEENYTLKDEITLIQNYAVIQKARFMNFDISFQIEEDVKACRIVKFLLQPVVENAILHGFARGKKRRGIIQINAYKDTLLHITIEDNGVGFDVERWRRMQVSERKEPEKAEAGHDEQRKDELGKKTPEAHSHTHIAINNIEQIIYLEYGKDYGIEISSEPGLGTKVEYRLPVVLEENAPADKEGIR